MKKINKKQKCECPSCQWVRHWEAHYKAHLKSYPQNKDFINEMRSRDKRIFICLREFQLSEEDEKAKYIAEHNHEDYEDVPYV